MNISTRLRELREAQKLSQGDIEERTGLFRCYISRVECGHTEPKLENLEKWAKALNLELYQLFFAGEREPQAPEIAIRGTLNDEQRRFVDVYDQLDRKDKDLLLSLARQMAKRRRK